MRAYDALRRTTDPDFATARRTSSKNWKRRNLERVSASRKAYHRLKHPRVRASALSHADFLATRRVRDKARYAATVAERVQKTLRTSLLQALRLYADGRKTQSVTDLIGCTVAELVLHLERQFMKGMTWENHDRHGWHIDHIRACATFDLTDPEQQRVCFHFTNLRPLWSKENIKKGKRLTLLL